AVVREGKVLDCNQGFLRFFEAEDKEEFNQRFDQFIQIFEDVNKEGYLAIDRLYQESLIEFLLSRKEKISKVAIKKEDRLLSFSLLLDEIELEGKKHQIFVLNDITELEMYREALEKRVAAEIEKNRFKERIMYEQVRRSAMGELLVNIAHQWRQPLNNIGILTQDIEDMHHFGELNEKSLQANVQKIMEQIRGLSETISKFTGFYDKKDVLAGFLVRETVEKIISLIKDGFGRIEIEVKIFIPSGLLLYNNSQALEEILMALFVNSKEALERRSRESGQITISSVFDEENGNLTLYFVDDAGGIPKDILPKIFDPYFTTKFQSQGVGLGLFMARNIVENRMYGSISAANTPNGAKFTLSIPTCK
ncbi:MAG: sensor histidine kinase, partial [Wolinella sp.]